MEAIQAEIISLITVVVVSMLGIVAQKTTAYLKSKGIVAKIEGNKELAKIVVQAIEQTYREMDGNQKLEVAKDGLINLMQEKKIKISEEEVDYLIENAVKEMKININKELKK